MKAGALVRAVWMACGVVSGLIVYSILHDCPATAMADGASYANESTEPERKAKPSLEFASKVTCDMPGVGDVLFMLECADGSRSPDGSRGVAVIMEHGGTLRWVYR